ncbi:hypothetical protein [Streptomyces sp. NPDC047070]|uniref:hypothetical protein n=1 Tax=Streptomyces sp. NPDC047070 TaxID=3154923 RepID=UPI0034537136
MNEPTPDAEELRIRSRLHSLLHGSAQPQPQLSHNALAAAAAAALHAAAQPTTPAHPAPQPVAQPVAQPASGSGDDWFDDLYDDDQPDTAAAAQPAAQPATRRPSWMRIPDWRTGQHVDLSQKDDDPDEEAEDEEDQDAEETGDEDTPDAEDEDGAEDEEQPDGSGKPSAQPRIRSRSRSRKQKAAQSGSRSRPAPRAGLDSLLPRRSLIDAYDAIPPRIRWLNLHASAAAAGYALGWVDFSTRTYAWFTENGLLNLSFAFWCAVAVGCEMLRRRTRQIWLPVRWAAAVPIASIVVGTLLYGTGWNELDLPL